MRKIIAFVHVSLDGYIAGPNNELDWGTMTDDAMGKYLIGELLEDVDSVVIGKNLYQGFNSFWPSVALDQNSPTELREFAQWLIDSPKYVFSTTLESADWNNSTLIKSDIEGAITQIKALPGKDIVVFGGASFLASLTKFGLIDEYRLKLEPVLLGAGKPLFGEGTERAKLKLTRCKEFESDVVGLYYQREPKAK